MHCHFLLSFIDLGLVCPQVNSLAAHRNAGPAARQRGAVAVPRAVVGSFELVWLCQGLWWGNFELVWLCQGLWRETLSWCGCAKGCGGKLWAGVAVPRVVVGNFELLWLCQGLWWETLNWCGCAKGCGGKLWADVAVPRVVVGNFELVWLCQGLWWETLSWCGCAKGCGGKLWIGMAGDVAVSRVWWKTLNRCGRGCGCVKGCCWKLWVDVAVPRVVVGNFELVWHGMWLCQGLLLETLSWCGCAKGCGEKL